VRTSTKSQNRLAVFIVTSKMLQYPDEELIECLDPIGEIVSGLPARSRRHLTPFLEYLRTRPLLELQSAYVDTFDLRQRNCLHLTFSKTGDTRGRGLALWRFGDVYRRHGLSLQARELPDFLPALLELCVEVTIEPRACDPADPAPFDLLVQYGPEIHLLQRSLASDHSPYAGVVAAIESVLPKLDGAVAEEARRLALEGPPSEQVGIAPDIRWLGEAGENIPPDCPMAAGPFPQGMDDLAFEEEALEVRR
jgi:nitrate reductase delta subunit